MNENNYKNLEGYRFLRILDGSESGFHIPMGGNLWAQVRTEHQAYRAAGIEPEVNVLIPPHHERMPHKLEMSMGSRPSNLWPDFNDPIIYRIDGFLYWNRGLNLATGEGPKPELTFGNDLLNCQFLTTYSAPNKLDQC